MKKKVVRWIVVLFIMAFSVLVFKKVALKLCVLIPPKYSGFIELKYVHLFDKTGTYEIIKQIHLPEFIAHGGGEIKGLTVTNSFEALDLNYKRGYRFFEVDINWTSDNHPVLIHDWEDDVSRLFGMPQGVYSLSDFTNFKSLYGLKQMTLNDLILWLTKHNDAHIVTDCKNNTLKTLELISKKNADILDRVIPQIYKFTEYNKVRALGFKTVILTLYVKNYSDNILLKFLENYPVSAVTMPIRRAMTNLPSKVNKLGIPVYAHTVNEKELMNKLKLNGVNGFYTDRLFY